MEHLISTLRNYSKKFKTQKNIFSQLDRKKYPLTLYFLPHWNPLSVISDDVIIFIQIDPAPNNCLFVTLNLLEVAYCYHLVNGITRSRCDVRQFFLQQLF